VRANELVDETFGMDPAKRMIQYIELAGIIADNEHIDIETVRDQTADQCTFSNDSDVTAPGYNGFWGPAPEPPKEAEIKRFCSQFSWYWNLLSF